MAIKDLKVREGKVDIVVEVVDKGEVREFEKFGKTGRVCNAKVKDESGEITLTLWNEDIDKINVGNKVHVINGYVSEWQGESQLTTGKFGQLEVVGEGSAPQEEAPAEETSEKEETSEELSESDKVEEEEVK